MSRPFARKSPDKISDLDKLILQGVSNGQSAEEISKAAKVPSATLGKEIALLQIKGYIANDGRLTDKGQRARQS